MTRPSKKKESVFGKKKNDIYCNPKIVNYLDVTLNLATAKYYPYRKPDNNPLYINAKSNHPPSIIKHLPASISTRISSLSCVPDEFNKASQTYNDALKTSGYHENLRYVNIFFLFIVWLGFFFQFPCSCGSCLSASIRLHCVDCETLGPVGACYLLLSRRKSFGEWFD